MAYAVSENFLMFCCDIQGLVSCGPQAKSDLLPALIKFY